ncbi:hypothetical protein HYQ46_003493 [Verticillium longisporum]|nr:hypothetical protein HYQ46_003493 [Verticillium longisporum]
MLQVEHETGASVAQRRANNLGPLVHAASSISSSRDTACRVCADVEVLTNEAGVAPREYTPEKGVRHATRPWA